MKNDEPIVCFFLAHLRDKEADSGIGRESSEEENGITAKAVKNRHPKYLSKPLIDSQIGILSKGMPAFQNPRLSVGYYQVPVASNSLERTAVMTPNTLYEFLRILSGLSNAPAVFEYLMKKALGILRNTISFTYIGDIFITLGDFRTRTSEINPTL